MKIDGRPPRVCLTRFYAFPREMSFRVVSYLFDNFAGCESNGFSTEIHGDDDMNEGLRKFLGQFEA